MNAGQAALAAAIGMALGPAMGSASAGLDLQGHRGARGLAPENTLPAFATALGIGVTTLEMDAAVSADGVVVISHDPRLNPDITRDASGRWIDAPGSSIHALTLARLRGYDVGRIRSRSDYARRFPRQVPRDGTRIPTLAEVIALTRRAGNDRVRFNVETKISPVEPKLTPPPEAFADALVHVLREGGVSDRASIQSFDWRTLRRVQEVASDVPTVYLSAQREWMDNIRAGQPGSSPWTAGRDVDDYGGSVPRMVQAAGGKLWSPYYEDATPEAVAEAHRLGLGVIVWTVNEPDVMRALIDRGVDGIITDYPDRLRAVMRERGMALPVATPVDE